MLHSAHRPRNRAAVRCSAFSSSRRRTDDTRGIDGQPIAEHEHIQRDFAFSPDGKRLAYVTLNQRDRTLYIHADGRSTQVKQLDSLQSPRFSPDNKRLAYAARQGGRSVLSIDDQPGAGFFSLSAGTLTWSPGGHHVACLAQRDGKSLLAIDAGASPLYDRIYIPARIPFDSEHSLVFLAVKAKNLVRVRVELPQ
jgi:Tol biopolymer transport system component